MNTTRTVRVLRILFIIGSAYLALSGFVPDTRLAGQTLHSWLNMGGSERLVSDLDFARLNFGLGQFGWGIYVICIYVVLFILPALAIFRPRRWVFITGAIVSIYLTLFNIVCPAGSEIHTLLISWVFDYIARALMLVGFAVKWPKPNMKQCLDCGQIISLRAEACPKCGAPQSRMLPKFFPPVLESDGCAP